MEEEHKGFALIPRLSQGDFPPIKLKEERSPFTVPLDDFERLSFNEWRALALKVRELFKGEVDKVFKEDPTVEFVVICDGKIIYTTDDLVNVYGDKLKDLMKSKGKPCYVFARPLLTEEAQGIR